MEDQDIFDEMDNTPGITLSNLKLNFSKRPVTKIERTTRFFGFLGKYFRGNVRVAYKTPSHFMIIAGHEIIIMKKGKVIFQIDLSARADGDVGWILWAGFINKSFYYTSCYDTPGIFAVHPLKGKIQRVSDQSISQPSFHKKPLRLIFRDIKTHNINIFLFLGKKKLKTGITLPEEGAQFRYVKMIGFEKILVVNKLSLDLFSYDGATQKSSLIANYDTSKGGVSGNFACNVSEENKLVSISTKSGHVLFYSINGSSLQFRSVVNLQGCLLETLKPLAWNPRTVLLVGVEGGVQEAHASQEDLLKNSKVIGIVIDTKNYKIIGQKEILTPISQNLSVQLIGGRLRGLDDEGRQFSVFLG